MKLVANDTIGNFKIVCEQTNLVEVYTGICEKYPCDRDNAKKKYDAKELLELIRSQGYEVKYNSREKFYSIFLQKDIGRFGYEMELKTGNVDFRIIAKIGDDWYLEGRLIYWIREVVGVKTLLPSMVSYDEVINMLNLMVDVLKEILDKWTRE